MSQLPCDNDGVCMVCKTKPSEAEKLNCNTCVTPWHVRCLQSVPETLALTIQWNCPDCTSMNADCVVVSGEKGELVAKIQAIESDESLTEQEKAKKRQLLLSGESLSRDKGIDNDDGSGSGNSVLDIIGENMQCSFCLLVPEMPVTAPCGHNFCLKCFQKWVAQGNKICAKCRRSIPPKMASQPRINSSLVSFIRKARMSISSSALGLSKDHRYVHNQDKPDKAYTTERAKKSGMANAASGRIFVTTPPDYFGPILPENDPERNTGVLVGECWDSRMECRQWGIHYPHVSGIAGQSNYGAQSVVISGGYEDDEDHGEWFLYTGSGGRDLSGNKRTSKTQSFDQTFKDYNEALRVSCKNGYPVRVVRSYKEKRSSYAPENGLRYDGIYRIEKCWRKVGTQGHKVCRYLFVRCDNEPAPWTSDEHGDTPRPVPEITELRNASDMFERVQMPSWDYNEERAVWEWKRPAPCSRKREMTGNGVSELGRKSRRGRKKADSMSVNEKLLKEFKCFLCKRVMTYPLTTPCGHNFCKSCLQGKFDGQTFTKERSRGGRTLRSQKTVMKCPACPNDISEFLQNPQVNTEMMVIIEKLQQRPEDEKTVDESIVKVTDTSEKGLEALSTDGDTDSSKTQTEVNTDSEEVTEALFQDAEIEAEYRTSTETKPRKRQKKADAGLMELGSEGKEKSMPRYMLDGDKISETPIMKSSGIMSTPSEEKTDVVAGASNLGEGQKP
ncbi:E3 ubiquitin-protein ligase ORTHRUS 2-like [Apium graveolens]|uniref:E3 ubiquitin-protein ligase ORTHRUS 2-like n=1 Tax=Apium graveolens TaxID=4045 RepID=UPI003D79B0A4